MTVLEFHIPDKTYTTTVPLTAGLEYTFKVQARSLFGFSDFSDEVTILAAQIPEVPTAPITTVVDRDVHITWIEPNDMGSAISGYRVKFIGNDGNAYSYVQDSC